MNECVASISNGVQVAEVVSLYSHILPVMLPVDASVKTTVRGAPPEVGLAENCAFNFGFTGAASTTVANDRMNMRIINIYAIFLRIINSSSTTVELVKYYMVQCTVAKHLIETEKIVMEKVHK